VVRLRPKNRKEIFRTLWSSLIDSTMPLAPKTARRGSVLSALVRALEPAAWPSSSPLSNYISIGPNHATPRRIAARNY
jgi:hypothetical protein